MQALLSPHSETALVFQTSGAVLLDHRGPKAAASLSPEEVSGWIATHEDVRPEVSDDLTFLYETMVRHARRQEALDLALIALDPQMPDDLREEALGELELALDEADTGAWLTSLFHIRPLPVSADMAGALTAARNEPRKRVSAWLERIEGHQSIIARAWSAWNSVPEEAFTAAGGRQRFFEGALDITVFSSVIEKLAKQRHPDARFIALEKLACLPGYREVTKNWLDDLTADPEKAHEVEPEGESHTFAERTPQRGKRGRRGYDRKAARDNAERQKTFILKMMKSGRLDRIPALVDELITFHDAFGGGEFAAKSLCDLAVQAKQLGIDQIQLDLTQLAVRQNPEDGWAWAQHGDALLANGRPDEALDAYRSAQDFGQRSVGGSGRAEVLKAMNRLPEALDAYEAISAEFPANVVARNGRAEVLKAMNRLPEALDAYEAISAQFPTDVFARNGRAEVLKAMNRLPEALDAYEAISAQFPTDVFARNGRAEVLKAMNRLPEALDAYEAISQIYGGDLIARNGRASVLLLMGRTEEALALLPQERPTCLQDWVGWHIFGMALLQAGQEARALENFSVGAEEGPPLESEYFVAAMALAQLRLGYLTEAQRELNRIHNPRLVGATNVVQFQVYAHKRDRAGMEQVSAALEAQGPAVCIELTTELRRRFLENKKGRYSEQWLRDQEIRCLALAA